MLTKNRSSNRQRETAGRRRSLLFAHAVEDSWGSSSKRARWHPVKSVGKNRKAKLLRATAPVLPSGCSPAQSPGSRPLSLFGNPTFLTQPSYRCGNKRQLTPNLFNDSLTWVIFAGIEIAISATHQIGDTTHCVSRMAGTLRRISSLQATLRSFPILPSLSRSSLSSRHHDIQNMNFQHSWCTKKSTGIDLRS